VQTGHGKSKIVEALRFVRDLVVDGTKAEDPIECPTFRLDSDLSEAASRFEIVIDYDGVEYSYGFVVDEKRVLEEWLFARLTSRESRFFERITDDDGKVTVEFGPALGGGSKKERQLLEFVAEGTRPDQLFLTGSLGPKRRASEANAGVVSARACHRQRRRRTTSSRNQSRSRPKPN
jgi:hypothetical protein